MTAARTQRHRWAHHGAYSSTCLNCGTTALKRPHPYGRYWFTEWHLPDGTFVSNYNGEPTPPCPGHAESAAVPA
jgi:hypothetical protein